MSIAVLLSYLTMQISGWRYHEEVLILRKNIADTDQMLTNLNVTINHRNIFIWIITICTASIINGVSYYIVYVKCWKVDENKLEKYVFSNVIHNMMIYVGGMVVMDFMTHVCWLEKNFKQINDLLKNFLLKDCSIEMEDRNNKMEAPRLGRCLNEWRIGHLFCRNKVASFRGTRIMKLRMSTSDKISMLQQIRYIHLQLCVITRLLNKIFDSQIIFHSIVTIQGLITTMYYTYTEVIVSRNLRFNGVLFMLCFYMCDACYAWLKMVLTCYYCEKTAKQAQQIVHIIHACTIHNSDIELKNEVRMMSSS
ncbi:uncharacterized protein LOC144477612 [Augochlora pura]